MSETSSEQQHDRVAPRHVQVAIAGGGFSGIGAAIRLRQEGIHDFVLLERAAELGGTWRDNSYPGCACDVESHLYSYSFAPNPDWSRTFSPRREIWEYLQRCAREHGLLPHFRFGHVVERASYEGEARRWRIETSQGVYTADFFVSALGAFSEPALPKLPGLSRFRGRLFHSARWDHTFDLRDRRVAVIGTGASAVQFVPAIRPAVRKLTLFQRTPAWVVPRGDRALGAGERRLFRALPATQRLARGLIYARRELMVLALRNPALMRGLEQLAHLHLARQVADPTLREKLRPRFRMGCKRILISDDYLPALAAANVELVTSAIAEVRESSIVDAEGREHELDAIICGTGFHVTDLPAAHHVFGATGESLHQRWGASPKAHLGTMVDGFPNFFMLLGPNTGLGHTSVLLMIESQLELLISALRHARERGFRTLVPTAEAQQRFVDEVDARSRGTVWTAGHCASWYLDQTGRNAALWPSFTFSFRRRLRFEPSDYHFER